MSVVESAHTGSEGRAALSTFQLRAFLRIVEQHQAQRPPGLIALPAGINRPTLLLLVRHRLIELDEQSRRPYVQPIRAWRKTLEAKLGPDWEAQLRGLGMKI